LRPQDQNERDNTVNYNKKLWQESTKQSPRQ
jgi:hypothetical protein